MLFLLLPFLNQASGAVHGPENVGLESYSSLCLHESCLTYSIRRAADSRCVPCRCFLPHYVREILLVTNLMRLCVKQQKSEKTEYPNQSCKNLRSLKCQQNKTKKSYSNKT